MKPNPPQSTPRYWIGVVNKNHVARGVAGGFAQLGHGKRAPLARMKAGDWLIYYSPKMSMDGDEACQAFTAFGQVKTGEIYEGNMGGGFVPNRLDVDYKKCVDAPIRPLIEKLAFIEDPKRWGYKFRFGHFEIGEADFELIAAAMGVAKLRVGKA
jgi:predicted RNA-binding protein